MNLTAVFASAWKNEPSPGAFRPGFAAPSPVTGEMYCPDAAARLHARMLQDLGLEYTRFHALRHTFATLALQNGVDIRTVSGMPGHADPGFTLRTYAHATNPMLIQAAETVGQFMSQNL